MKSFFNKKTVSAIAVVAIVAIVYVLCFVLIPFPKYNSGWISFGFTLASFFIGLGIYLYAFKDGSSPASKLYGFPVFRIGYIYVIAQLVLGIVICRLDTTVDVPEWITVLASVVLLALASIGVILTDNARDAVEGIEAEAERVIMPTKLFKLDIAATVDLCTDETVKKELVKLAEDIKYSDPVSSEATEEVEDALFEEMAVLRSLVEGNDSEGALEQTRKVTNLLNERNRICKAFKK